MESIARSIQSLTALQHDRLTSTSAYLCEGCDAFHDLDGVASDADVRDLVSIFGGANENLTWAFHLHALFDVHGLLGLRDSIAHHPGHRASCCGTRGCVLASGKD